MSIKKALILFKLSFALSFPAFGAGQGNDGKSFLDWAWHDQLRPTIEGSWDDKSVLLILSGAGSTALAHQFDRAIYEHHIDPDHRFMGSENGKIGGFLGSGGPGIAIALTQLYFDYENGLQTSRAISLTAVNHILLAMSINRQRPNERDYLSMPSAHTASSFTVATSLAYSYGWKVAVPAYLVATYVSLTRVSENIHWLSDITAGATVGIYWGRASALLTSKRAQENNLVIAPLPIEGGALLSASWDF